MENFFQDDHGLVEGHVVAYPKNTFDGSA